MISLYLDGDRNPENRADGMSDTVATAASISFRGLVRLVWGMNSFLQLR